MEKDTEAGIMAHTENYIDDGRLKHGDRALAMVGDERVQLTDEDVSIPVAILHMSKPHG